MRAERLAEERRLLLRWRETRDQAAREELVHRFLPLAQHLARRYGGGREPLDDLVQVASMGLVKAVDRFDPDRGVAFSSFAVPTILGELRRHLRDTGWAVRVPRSVQERVLDVTAAIDRLSSVLGRSPSSSDVADELGITTEEVLEAREAGVALEALSLDAPRRTSDKESEGETRSDALGADDERLELVELGATIAPTLEQLSARDREILHLRFVEDMTQSEIASRIGVSQMHVSRLLRRALARLREPAEQHVAV